MAGTPTIAEGPLQSTEGASIQVLPNHSPVDRELQWPSPVSYSGSQGPRERTTTPRPGLIANTCTLPVATVNLEPTAEWVHAVRDDLLILLSSALLSLPALEAVNKCIDLYMQYVFPTAPMVHEPTLRASALRFFSSVGATELFTASSRQDEITHMRDFVLLTALCASVASIIPESLLPYRRSLAEPCLNTSRHILKALEDFDLENPNSTSIAIRILHATALQQITGKTTLTYYVLGQATLLIRNMRLHSEEALKGYNAVESQILRSIFWQIYAADKASACLGNRPFFLHELLFNEELTLRISGEPLAPLLDTSKPWCNEEFEERLFTGFHFLPHLWSSAASLLFDIREYRKGNQNNTKASLTQAYMKFLSIIDSLPHWLQVANIISSCNDGVATQFQKTAFWVQRCTVLGTFQCLRLVILQQCIASKVWDIMGLNDQDLTLPMAKIGIIHDFVQTLDDIPFVYLQVKGEPTVSTIAAWYGQLLTALIR